MKKSFILLYVFILISCFLYSANYNLYTSVDVPFDIGTINYYDAKYGNSNSKASQGGISLGGNLGLDVFFSDKIGVGIDLGFYGTPLYIKPAIGNKFSNMAATFCGNGFFNGKVNIGPVFRLLKKEKYILDIKPGIEIDYFVISGLSHNNDKESFFICDYGLGFDTKMSFYMTDRISLNVGLYNGVSFFQSVAGYGVNEYGDLEKDGSINQVSSFNKMFNYRFDPIIGVGFFF